MENERDVAAARVRKYLAERARIPNIDSDLIHGLHTGDEEREAELTASDLRVLTEYAQGVAADAGVVTDLPPESEMCGVYLMVTVPPGITKPMSRCVNRKPCAIPGHES